MTKQVQAWAEKNKVEVAIDFITSNGFKIQVTQAAEAQAGTGHDLLPFYSWEVQTYADKLEPVDDVIKTMTAQYGKYSPIAEYLASSKGHWKAVPSSTGNLNLTCCGRISLLKELGRHRHQGDVSGGAVGPDGRRRAGTTMHSSRPRRPATRAVTRSLWAWDDRRLGQQHRHHLLGVRRGTGERQGRDHGRFCRR